VTDTPPRVLFLAWTKTSGRAEDISAALRGDAHLVFPRVPLLPHPFSTALRYAIGTVQSALLLLRARPSAVVVTNPPLIPPLVVALWAAATRRPFVLDSHPSGFGLKGRRVLAVLQPVHRALARRATGVLVTTNELAGRVDAWGGRGIVVHEAPVDFPEPSPPTDPTVLFVGIFASDEPIDAVLDAARLLPDTRFRITGDPRRAPAQLVGSAPANVELTGFLATEAYRSAVSGASVVLTLTTEPHSVMRSAYEAVYAHVPVVMTDTAVLRGDFPYALFCENTGASIAAALRQALASQGELRARAPEAAALQRARWDKQLVALREACAP
jgi:glycosyltransferase involved in cell wall biosynthesis